MTEKSAKCEARQLVPACRSHGGRAARSTVQRSAEATPLHRRSTLFPCALEKAQTILRAVILNLERLEPYCGALFLQCIKVFVLLLLHQCVKLLGARQLLSGVHGMRWCGRNGIFTSTWQCVRPCT